MNTTRTLLSLAITIAALGVVVTSGGIPAYAQFGGGTISGHHKYNTQTPGENTISGHISNPTLYPNGASGGGRPHPQQRV